jgi:ATP-binding cassette subfamily B protein
MRYYQQSGVNDCGAACLTMLASHYRSYVSLGRVRELCKTDAMGANFAGLMEAAKKLGLSAKGFRGEVRNASLDAQLIFPFIAQVKVIIDGQSCDHFVVLRRISRGSVEIWNPDPAKGRQRLSRRDFLAIWTGYVLMVTPAEGFAPEKGKGNVLLKFLPLLVPHRKTLVIVGLASILLVVFGVLSAFYYKYVVDEIIVSKAEFTLSALSIGVLVVAITQALVDAGRNLLINFCAYKMDLQLSFSYVAHILKLPLSFFDSRMTGEIISRLGDIQKIRAALSGTFLSLMVDGLLLLVIGPILFNISGTLFAVLVITALTMGVLIFIFSLLYVKSYTRLRNEEAAANSSLVETIGGAYTVKALNAEKTQLDQYEDKMMTAFWTLWRTGIYGILQGLFTVLISGVSSIVIFWLGSSAIIDDTLSFGALISFNALAAYFTGPLFRLVNLQASLQEAYVAAERVNDILELNPEQDYSRKFLKPQSLAGAIEFSHVSFKYGMRPPLYKDLSLRIEKGWRVGFVGPSGSGKTTLTKLLLKFYTPDEGAILIDGYDIRDMDIQTLRSRIGYVPQDVHIFSGTIADNIALHNPASSLEEIALAARRAGAAEFIDRLPERYNTRLSERGSILSGGERQRLALARALLGKPDILILDEATSNLDAISERSIHGLIESLGGSMTTLIIAHRLTTVKDCDTIFVMDQGAIVESGNHGELLAGEGLYKSLWENMIL